MAKPTGMTRLAVTVVIAALAVCGIFYAMARQSQNAEQNKVDENNQKIAEMMGINNAQTKNLLDARFKDADNDLVADMPTDSKDLVDPPKLKFSYISSDDPEKFKAAFKELMAAISAATGKEVEYVEYASPEDELLAFSRGDLQIAGFNTGLVPVAVCTSGFRPSVMMADGDGAATYHAEIITAAGSPVKQLTDLKSREVTFTEPTSNSGYKAAALALRDAGLKPPQDYIPRYSQGHLQSIEGLHAKTFENIAVASDVLKRAEAVGLIQASEYRSIYTSPKSFPTAAIGFGNNLKPELAKKIHDVLVNFKWSGTGLEGTFGKEGRARFVDANYLKDWEFVRQVDDTLGVPYKMPTGEPTLYTVPPPPSTEPSAREADEPRTR